MWYFSLICRFRLIFFLDSYIFHEKVKKKEKKKEMNRKENCIRRLQNSFSTVSAVKVKKTKQKHCNHESHPQSHQEQSLY